MDSSACPILCFGTWVPDVLTIRPDNFTASIIKTIYRHVQTLYSFFQTSLPFTHVQSTFPVRSRTTKSASTPGRSVPFRFSIPRHRAGLVVTHLIASPREHPVKREKLRTQVSRVTTLRVGGQSRHGSRDGKWAKTHLPARVSVPSRYNFAPSFTNRLPSRHSCTPSFRCGSSIFMAAAALVLGSQR